MRKLVLSTFLALPALLFAECLSLDEAQSVAEKFFSNAQPSMYKSAAEAPQVNFIWDGEEPVYKRVAADDASTVNDPAFYVFNKEDGKGFVIVSGESETVQPILGYSLDKSFKVDNMPANVYNWMMGYRQEIQLARENLFADNSSAEEGIDLTEVHPMKPIKLLETAEWGQSGPFNSKLPNSYMTGCSATATSIIMRYHQWPDKGVGTIPAVNKFVGAVELDHTYDWAKMPLEYTKKSSKEEVDQVGTLMRDVSVMLRTRYDSTGSGAMVEEILPKLLPVFFRYNAESIEVTSRNEINNDQLWHLKLQAEINENRPILYTGADSLKGGHSFVLDGYAAENYYHVNWGWDGDENGYYLLTTLNPIADEKEGKIDRYDFYSQQCAITGIQPDETNPGGGYYELLEFSRNKDEKEEFGIIPDRKLIEQNIGFVVQLSYVVNRGSTDFTGKVHLYHVSPSANAQEEICKPFDCSKHPLPMNDTIYFRMPPRIKSPILEGDQVIVVYDSPKDKTPKILRAGDTYGYQCQEKLKLIPPTPPTPTPTAVEESVVSTIRVMADAGKIQVEGLTEMTAVAIYSLNGQLVASAEAESTAKFELPADQIYIVRVGEQSWKVKL